MSLLSLPMEIQIHTICHLQFRDVLSCRRLSQHFRALVDSNRELKFTEVLGSAGLKEVSTCAEKTKRVWELNVAWANLHWLCRRQIQLSGTGPLFDVSDGLFFHTVRSTGDDSKSARVVRWLRLSSRRDPDPSHDAEHVTFDVALTDFAVDASRDLIIGIELTSFRSGRTFTITCNFYAKTISTNEVHPDAHRRVLSSRFVSPTTSFEPLVEICGNHIAVLLSRCPDTIHPDSFDIFLLLDWTTGVSMSTMGTFGMKEHWGTFCFLTPDTVLIPSTFNSLLNVYHFDNNADSLMHDVTLLLPEPIERDRLQRIALRAQPFSSSSTYSSHPTGDTPAFVPDPDEAVVVLSLDYRYGEPHSNGQDPYLSQVVAIPRRTLVHYARLARKEDPQLVSLIEKWHGKLDEARSSQAKAPGTINRFYCDHEQFHNSTHKHRLNKRTPHVHAEQWIHQTRWGIDSPAPSMGYFAHGSRYLGMSSRTVVPNAPASCVTLYDFNLRIHRRGHGQQLYEENFCDSRSTIHDSHEPAASEDEEERDYDGSSRQPKSRRWPVQPYETCTTPATVFIPEVFKKPFTTCLPYRVVETDMVLPWDSAIIDGERIIGLEFSDFNTGSIDNIDVIVI